MPLEATRGYYWRPQGEYVQKCLLLRHVICHLMGLWDKSIAGIEIEIRATEAASDTEANGGCNVKI